MSDDLKSRVSILAVIGDRVQLRRNGAYYVGSCPFHKDDTPSFTVYHDQGRYHCYGCGADGDVYEFLQKIEGIDFAAAKRRLAEIAGVDLDAPAPVAVMSDRPRNTAVYPYTDERGKRLFEIVRREWMEGGKRKKTFLQRHWDASGAEVWKKHPRQVLYRLEKIAGADEVWLVEGEKDVHSLEALGLVATTAPGGSNARWLAGYSGSLAGKRVWIIPDNDEPGAKHAQKAFDALSACARVAVVRVPGPEHSDVTDWLAAGGTIETLLEIAAAAAAEADAAAAALKVGAKREPNDIAKEIMGRRGFLADMNGAVYEYNDRFWEKITSKRLRQYAQRADGDQHTNQRRRGEIADYIETAVQVPRIQWRQLAPTEVPLWNGVYDVLSMSVRKHRREDYLETAIPVAYQEQAICPTWSRALVDYFGGDPDCDEKILALQQFFGYALLPHARYKKALVLFGESDTGKSQVAQILGELVGQDNRCSVSVEDMDDARKRVPIVGKMLNVLTELSSRSVIADSGFKTLISTEEPLLFDPKFIPPFMYAPACKHLIACNQLPQINDLSKATFNRLLLIKFNRVLKREEQDRDFFQKLKAELPGILTWALGGALDLIEHGGQFQEIAESQDLLEEYRLAENEINTFLLERADRDDDSYVLAADVRSRFRTWAGRNYSDQSIGRMMRSAGYPSSSHPGEASRRHYGIKWKDTV